MTFEGPEPRPPAGPTPPAAARPRAAARLHGLLPEPLVVRRRSSGVGGIAKAIVILLGVYVVGALIAIAGTPSIVDSAEDFLAGTHLRGASSRTTTATYGADRARLSAAAQLAIVVLTIIWTYRLVKNHRTIGRRDDVGTGHGDRRLVPPAVPVRHPDARAARGVEGRRPGGARRATRAGSRDPDNPAAVGVVRRLRRRQARDLGDQPDGAVPPVRRRRPGSAPSRTPTAAA